MPVLALVVLAVARALQVLALVVLVRVPRSNVPPRSRDRRSNVPPRSRVLRLVLQVSVVPQVPAVRRSSVRLSNRRLRVLCVNLRSSVPYSSVPRSNARRSRVPRSNDLQLVRQVRFVRQRQPHLPQLNLLIPAKAHRVPSVPVQPV